MEKAFKKIIIVAGLLFLLSFDYPLQSDTYSLAIKVEGLRNSKGVVQFTLYNTDGSIPDEKFERYYKKQTAIIDNETSTVTFNELPLGRYAINILHDENENGKIDKGFILPIEGIGFSNYKSIGLTNRPNFSKASFELDSGMTKLVKIIYL
jgi:uncharacterized protein (DUF2141 family)